MIIVLDTNVLVAGLLSPFGPCGNIVRMASSGKLRLGLDARIVSEYRAVLLRPKFRFDPERIEALLDQTEHRGIFVASCPLPEPLPDPDDEAFLEVAIASGATCLVTGNLIHFPLTLCEGVAVHSPSEFLETFRHDLARI